MVIKDNIGYYIWKKTQTFGLSLSCIEATFRFWMLVTAEIWFHGFYFESNIQILHTLCHGNNKDWKGRFSNLQYFTHNRCFYFCQNYGRTVTDCQSPILIFWETWMWAEMLCSKDKVDQHREQSLLCWKHLLVCCWPSLPAAISAKREHVSQAAGHSQYLSDPQLRFRLPWPFQPLSPETPAVCAGQSAHVYVWDRLRPEALSP